MGFSVCKLNTITNTYTTLYDYIPDINDAELLSQLAMINKKDFNELIFIFPGANRDISKNESDYKKALELADEYKVDKVCEVTNEISRIKKEILKLLDDTKRKINAIK